MPLFKYSGVDPKGKKIHGVIKADHLNEALNSLKKQNLYVLELTESKLTKEPTFKKGMLVGFTRDLSQLLNASLPLYESLLEVEEKYKNSSSHSVIVNICEGVRKGEKLSKIMGTFPKIFDKIYVSMVTTGEEIGQIDRVFAELTLLLTRQDKLKKQIVSAMIYPCFLLSFCFVVIIALLFFLIPSMEQLFEGRELEGMTQFVINTSLFCREHVVLMSSSLFVVIALFVLLSRLEIFKIQMAHLFLAIPILNNLITQTVIARFARTLSVLLKSSVSFLEALQLAKKIMNHPLFEKGIDEAQQGVLRGESFSSKLDKNPYFPPLAIRMIAIAQEAGTMPTMLMNLAEIYEAELDKSLTRFTTMLQPVILLVLAVIVGVVIMSILLPLTDVGSFLNG